MPDAILSQEFVKIVDAGSRVIVKADNDVPFPQSSIPCRAFVFERHNQNSTFNGQVVIAHDTARQRNVLAGQADVAAADFAVANQTTGDELGSVNRSSKADPCAGKIIAVLTPTTSPAS